MNHSLRQMKHYEKYKPSGIEWLGEIPEHWGVKRLKFNTYIKARVGWHGLRADEFSLTEGVFCVTGTDLQNGEINWENCYRVSEERYEEDPYIQLRGNDLLITKDGTIGKVAVVKNLNERATLNSGVFVVRPERKEYVTPFMYWALQSPVFSEYVNYTSKGSTINHLYQETFFNLPFILPLPEEQTAIANYLDEKTTQIDSLIANKQKLIDLLKEERTAIINQAVTKGLNYDSNDSMNTMIKRSDEKNHSQSNNQINHSSRRMKPSGIEWLGDIPEHWEVKKLRYVADVVLGKMLTNEDKGGYHLKPYLRAANLQWLNVDVSDVKEMWFSPAELEKLKLKENDLLVSEGGEVGRTCIWNEELDECYIQNSVHKITVLNPNEPKYFLYQFYSLGQNGIFESMVNRISIAHLTGEKIKEVTLLVPPQDEQTSIVHHIETHTTRIAATISKIEKEIELMQEYRTALISEVVTGKVKVSNFD
ncbi:MAG: restriction endonuclease subunit S [Nitrospirae bacterium]|nr:restriction endonuclease subunit S [Nitrospirota bacterium]